ncbi:MAG: glycosyltransferase family 39 protein [Candidatus Moranbacteria bacterium]|nr:glycosyltransferase family 39 protein [Candidatus Moranbacteria bacterium]
MRKRIKTRWKRWRSVASDYIRYKPEQKLGRRQKYLYLLLGAVIVIGAFAIRAYHISSLPPGIYPDEAVNGTDAINAIETGHFRLFYPNNYGREGLYINLIALGFIFFGVSIITLKIWSVFFGTLTVLGMIFLGRELFRSWHAGLVAGFLYATTFWAINFNRIAFRANMLPFVLVFSFYFLFRGLRTKKKINYVLAGTLFGLGTHTYIAFRVAPAILIALFIALILAKKSFLKTYWKEISIYVLSMFFVALPILLTFYAHPEYFETRSEAVSVFSPKVNQGHLWQALGTSARLTFGMFNFKGDQNWRHNLPSQPELQSWTGTFFLIGIIFLFFQLFYWIFWRIKNGIRNDNLTLPVLLLSWIFIMLLPEMLAYEGLPHTLRAIGSLPAAILIAVFSIEVFRRWIMKISIGYIKIPLYILLVSAVLFSGYISTKRYFVDWGQSLDIHPAFSQNLKNMALYLNSAPDSYHKYIVANAGGQIMDDGLPVSAEAVKMLTYYRTPGITYLRPGFDPSVIKSPAKMVLMYYDGVIIADIKSRFSNVYIQKLDPQPGNGTDYFVININ